MFVRHPNVLKLFHPLCRINLFSLSNTNLLVISLIHLPCFALYSARSAELEERLVSSQEHNYRYSIVFDFTWQERLDLIKATMLVKALGDNLYREDRWCWLLFVINRKKEEFDALADSVVSMPVGEMEHTIQDYLESQVCNSEMEFSADGPLSGRNHQDFCRCRCT